MKIIVVTALYGTIILWEKEGKSKFVPFALLYLVSLALCFGLEVPTLNEITGRILSLFGAGG
ncbi:MAG: hypothetical protein IKV63_02755 [Clostridia bacterium]|nr:hypothetical protein [Clostridia bacterium]